VHHPVAVGRQADGPEAREPLQVLKNVLRIGLVRGLPEPGERDGPRPFRGHEEPVQLGHPRRIQALGQPPVQQSGPPRERLAAQPVEHRSGGEDDLRLPEQLDQMLREQRPLGGLDGKLGERPTEPSVLPAREGAVAERRLQLEHVLPARLVSGRVALLRPGGQRRATYARGTGGGVEPVGSACPG